jgi:transposase
VELGSTPAITSRVVHRTLTPELNPVENIWQYLRANWLSNRVFETYHEIIEGICDAWQKLIAQPETIKSIGTRQRAHIGQAQ